MSAATLIRPATDADMPAITAIYAWNVLNGTGTFELDAPDEEEMARRREDVISKGLPWLVAERGDSI
jgi:L-amino acid N-acyltransferase YncA